MAGPPAASSLWLVNVHKDCILVTNGVQELQTPSQRLVGNQLRNSLTPSLASLVAQRLKHLSGMWETQVRSLGRENPLEKEVATLSSTLAWRIPWREEPGRLQSIGSQIVGLTEVT